MSTRTKRILIGLASPRSSYTADLLVARGFAMMATEVGWNPNTDIFETEDEVVIRIEAAGLDPDHLQVQLQGEKLTVRGYRPETHSCAPVTYQQMEIAYGPFEKVFVLPEEIRSNPIRARYQRGILEILISKQQPQSGFEGRVELQVE